jgi:hypothetical protein
MTIAVASKISQNYTIGTALTYGLVGCWHLDEGTGTHAYDASGNSHTGTLYNSPSWVVGKFGKALQFVSASSQYVQTSGAVVDTTLPFTFSAWVYPTAYPASFAYPLAQTGFNVGLSIGSTGYVAQEQWNTVPTDFSTGSLSPIPLNQWTMITGIFTGSYVQLYVNGSFASQTAFTGTPMTNNNNVGIGYIPGGSPNYFDGIVDEARIYQRALSATEVAQLYTEGAPCVIINNETDIIDIVPLTGAVGIWHLDENTGSSVKDASTSALGGTLQGSTTWVTGKFGYGLESAAGNGPSLRVADNSIFGFLNLSPYSIFTWVKLSAMPGVYTYPMVFYKEQSNMSGRQGWNMWINQEPSNHILLGSERFRDGSADSTSWLDSSDTITLGTWHHYGLTFDGTYMRMYWDGVLKAQSGVCTKNLIANGGDLWMGYSSAANDAYMDEARIYNRALSDGGVSVGTTATGEVAQLYKEGNQFGDFIVESLLDLRNMVAGDSATVTEYIAVDDSNSHIYQRTPYTGAQAAPLIRFHGKIFYKGNLYRVTLKQTAGTGKSFPVSSIFQLLNS